MIYGTMIIINYVKILFLIQIAADTCFLTIHDGGSEKAEMIANLNGTMNAAKISTPGNQIFVVLHTNGKNASIRFNAAVIKSK